MNQNAHAAQQIAKENRAYAEALAQAMRCWQPIETAPKDKAILLGGPGWVEEGQKTVIEAGRYYIRGEYRDMPHREWFSDLDTSDYGGRTLMPTHWMPLPPLPEPPK